MPNINDSKVILVIGATSGIGRALALALHALPSNPTVIVSGRRKDRLDEVVALGPGNGKGKLEAIQVDVDVSREKLKAFVENVIGKYPKLDTVVFSSGVQHHFDFTKPEEIDLDKAASELNINYTAIFTLITFFLPHLLKLGAEGQPTFLIPISSGIGLIPFATLPNYSATKSAVHSLCIALHAQLKDKNVHVMELIPPLVESELHDHQGLTPTVSKIWMPLTEYTKLTLEGLQRGDLLIPAGHMANVVEEFKESEKVEKSLQMFEMVKKMYSESST